MQSDTPDLSYSSSTISTSGGWSRPPTPTTPILLPQQSSTNPPSYTPIRYIPTHILHPDTQSRPRTTNRKLATVRSNCHASSSRLEVRDGSNIRFDNAPEHSTQPDVFVPDITKPEHYQITTSRDRQHQVSFLTHPSLSTSRYPDLAVQACIRFPGRSAHSTHSVEYERRFPSGRVLRHEGISCSSNPCTAPNTRPATPVPTIFRALSSSPDFSETSSLRRYRHSGENVYSDMAMEMNPNAHSADLILPFVGSTKPNCVQIYPTSATIHNANISIDASTSFPSWAHTASYVPPLLPHSTPLLIRNHRNAKIKETAAWENLALDTQFPRRPYSLDSDESTVVSQKRCAFVRRLKKMFGRRKARG